jgi:hypothetical protein
VRRWPVVLCALLLGAPACAAAADDDWTALTMAQDGSWGVASRAAQWQAMADAITLCRAMTGASDCGASFALTRGGWIAANLCGDYKVLATGATREGAEADALNREISLQLQFVPDLPPCRRVVTVDASGSTIVSSRPNPAVHQRAARD